MQETKEELLELIKQTEADREKARQKGLFATELVFDKQIERLRNLLKQK